MTAAAATTPMSADERRGQILSLLAAVPGGLNAPAIGRHIGVGMVHAGHLMRRLHAERVVTRLAGGRATRWVLPHHAEAALAEIAATAREVRRQARERALARAAQFEAGAAEFEFRHRVVPAADAEPLRPRGPASVFHLAEEVEP